MLLPYLEGTIGTVVGNRATSASTTRVGRSRFRDGRARHCPARRNECLCGRMSNGFRRSVRGRGPAADLSDWARKACRQLGRYARIFPIGEPRFRLSQGRYLWLHHKHTKAHQAWQRSLAAANRLSMVHEQGQAHYEIARHLEPKNAKRRSHLERAHQSFTQCSETYYKGLVEQLMSVP
jgi:hypothetical protein